MMQEHLSSTRTHMMLMRQWTMCITIRLDSDPRPTMRSGINMLRQLGQNLMTQIRKPVLLLMMMEKQLKPQNHQSQSPIDAIRKTDLPGNRLALG